MYYNYLYKKITKEFYDFYYKKYLYIIIYMSNFNIFDLLQSEMNNMSESISLQSIKIIEKNNLIGGDPFDVDDDVDFDVDGDDDGDDFDDEKLIGGDPLDDNLTEQYNKLLEMITSDNVSSVSNQTDTNQLENQLRDILNQEISSHKQDGGNDINYIKNFFSNLKSQGVDVNIKLNDKTMTEFFDLAQNTTTDISSNNHQTGGKNKKNKKNLKGGERGSNPGFMAYLDLRKHVALTLGIPNGQNAGKIASEVLKKIKKEHPNLTSIQQIKKATEYFNSNKKHYQDMHKK